MPNVLDYGSSPRRFRRNVKRVTIATILFALTASGLHFWPSFRERLALLYWQRQCENYSLAPNVVVYEEEPVRASELLKTNNYDQIRPNWNSAIMRRIPVCLDSARQVFNEYVIDDPLLFLHLRKSQNGNERLVLVQSGGPGFSNLGYLLDEIDVQVKVPMRPFDGLPPTRRELAATCPDQPDLIQPDALRLFAGQSDPIDASHFTIDYEFGNAHGTIDGWLRDDDSIDLSVRSGPATRPSGYLRTIR